MKIDFKVAENLIVASHITGIYDVNRSTTLVNDDFSLVADWAESVISLGLNAIIFHNNFSEANCKLHQNNNLHFVNVDYNPLYNPNVFRYSIYADFLRTHGHDVKNIFFTDVSDVLVLRNPFKEPLYLEHPDFIFCGDEPEILENVWMQNHSQHLRSKIADYSNYETMFAKATLLNCGVFGGHISILSPFIKALWEIHEKNNSDNKTAFTGDMGAFNYLIRTQYEHKVFHGRPVNTVFKSYTTDPLCWFKHK